MISIVSKTRCPFCQWKAIGPESRFCPHCGKPVGENVLRLDPFVEDERFHCPECKVLNRPRAKRCEGCGLRFQICPQCKALNPLLARQCRFEGALLVGYPYSTHWMAFRGNAARTGATPETVEPPLSLLWRYPSTVPPVEEKVEWTSPAVAYGIVYLGGTDRHLWAFDGETGDRLWQLSLDEAPHTVGAAPAVSEMTVYLGTLSGRLYAANALTGERLWETRLTEAIVSGPAVAGEKVLVSLAGRNGGSVAALDRRRQGDFVWQCPLPAPAMSSPAVWEEAALVGCRDHHFYALDLATGAIRWQFAAGGPINTTPAVEEGVAYIGSRDFKVYALKVDTGELLWQASTEFYVDASPSVANGIVYAASDDDRVYAFSTRTGGEVGRCATRQPVRSSPAVSGENVYVGSNDGGLYAMHPASGRLLCEPYETGAAISASPAVADGNIYFASNNGVIYALRGQTRR